MPQPPESQIPPPSDTNVATWIKYMILSRHCEQLSIANKREIFSVMRSHIQDKPPEEVKGLYHLYLPKFGLTLGECALFHTISEHIRRSGV